MKAPLISLELSHFDEDVITQEVRTSFEKNRFRGKPIKDFARFLRGVFKGRLYYSENENTFYLISPDLDLSAKCRIKKVSILTLESCVHEIVKICFGKIISFFVSKLIIQEMKKN